MIVKKLQINGFGNIKNKELELSEGINVIYGKNETGKSTIANFIKCIFYGVNRNKAGNEFSEYELRKPWENVEFSGKMEYVLDGKKYTVFRDFNRNNCKVYDENGTDITAEFSKDKIRGSEIGFCHFGIDEDTFENTLLVSQAHSMVELDSQKSMIQKLTNILQSGGESISFEKIKSKLQKKLLDEIGTERTHNKPINLVKRELVEIERTRQNLLTNRERKIVLENRQKELQKQMKDTEKTTEDTKQILEIREKYVDLLNEKERTYELTKKIKEKERQDKIANNRKQYRNAIILLIIVTMLSSVCLVIFKEYIWILVEMLLAIIGGVALTFSNQKNIPEEEIKDFDVTKEELNKKEMKELEKLRKSGIKDTYLDRKAPELKTLLAGLEKKKNDLVLEEHKIKIEEESLQGNIERLTDVEEQLVNLKEKQEELTTKSKVIHTSIQVLEEAYEDLKSRVLPELQKNIQKQIAVTTNGKYQNAIYNNEEGILVENLVGDLVPVSKLSIGTIDQMYLGFRLGLSEKMGNLPLILDESFAYYDNERLENLLQSFQNLHRQIIILTCSEREKVVLDKLHIDFWEVIL